MNDKRNLIFGNVMLLSQSRGEIFSVCFCQKFRFWKKNQSLRWKEINFDLRIAG